jgi:hypothetical protein
MAAIEKAQTQQEKSPDDDDLDIFNAVREVEIAGERVTVREINFGEQLRHNTTLRFIADDLKDVLNSPKTDLANTILYALSNNGDEVTQIISICCGKPTEWIEGLSGEDGELLMAMWWSVNQGFFVRRLLSR